MSDVSVIGDVRSLQEEQFSPSSKVDMVGEHRRAKQKADRAGLMGNHQRCWLWGRNAVLETLQAARWKPLELIVSRQLPRSVLAQVEPLAHALKIPLMPVEAERLTELCHARDHQGLAARMPPFPYQSVSDLLESAHSPALLVLLDCVQDPFNLGAICRAAHVFGADGVLMGARNQVEITSQVARSSAGAINRLNIARGDSAADIAKLLRTRGVQVVGTSPKQATLLPLFDFRQPVAIVIGNEGAGMSDAVLAECDALVTIPQATTFDSLNAAVSAGVILYEAHRQRLSLGATGPGSGISR